MKAETLSQENGYMFTGLIEKTGKLLGIERQKGGAVLKIGYTPWPDPLVKGESISVHGACLTVVSFNNSEFSADILDETLAKTNLGSRSKGDLLNLERALRADGRLGGHIITGHIDGTGRVAANKKAGRDWALTVSCGPDILNGIVKKGSSAIDGVSLTVSDLNNTSFTVNIIPFTSTNTSLETLQAGDVVNIETDVIGKYVLKYRADEKPSSVDFEKLRNAGFI